MADAPDRDQKTEAPTDKRRRDARAKGETLQSRELGTALVIGAGIVWASTIAAGLVAACRVLLRDGLTLAAPATIDPAVHLLDLARGVAGPLAGFAALVIAGAVAGPLITAPHLSAGAVVPKWSRIDPAAGFARMFGAQAWVELGKAVVKALLIFGAGGAVIAARMAGLATLGAAGPATAAARAGDAILALLVALGGALAVIAAIDLPIQALRHNTRLRMSKQEVHDEARESEGSPETKASQRRMARAAAKRQLAPALAEATVVVVNPAHFAVALRYDPARDLAPIVVAKGRDVIAEAIRELAAFHNCPVLRYPELTRAIYFTANVGSPIRDDLYAAVAAVLAFVLSLDAAAREQPEIDVPAACRFDADGRATTSPSP